MKPLWKFAQHGQSGQWASDLFPKIARHVDDLCFLRGMHTEGIAHGPATLFLHTRQRQLRAAVDRARGSLYGLGTENHNLPGFVTITPSMGNGGPRNYGNAFLPTVYQGTAVGRAGISASRGDDSQPHQPNAGRWTSSVKQFDLLQALNAEQLKKTPGDAETEAVIDSYELACRMQTHAPDVLDLSKRNARRPAPSTASARRRPTTSAGSA